jgi:dTDP-4-amino-4,6-dideoxygalactose transaminase
MKPGDEKCFLWPDIDEATVDQVNRMMHEGRISFDLETFENFEAALRPLFGVRYALCCNNGTAACFSAMKALGISRGDTVIAPAISHWASVLPAVQCGARVALADILPGSCRADPESAERLIDETTRAVVVTHTLGEPVQLDTFRRLCDRYRLALIEDVSHAHGATYQGQPVGSFGDISFCSFQANKLVCGGEGGALLTNRADLYYRAMEIGHPRRLLRAPAEWSRFAAVGRGFKFRPSALLIAIAHGSLKRLPGQIAVRKRACEEFRDLLSASPFLTALHREPEGGVYYCSSLLLHESDESLRDRVIAGLRARGVPADRLWLYLPGTPSLEEAICGSETWPVAQDVVRRLICMRAFTRYDPEVVQRCAQAVLETVKQASENRGRTGGDR